MKEVFLAGLCRTPIGSFGGTLKDTSAAALGEIVIKEALARAGVAPELVEEVFFGCVLSAGQGQNMARQAAVRAGIPTHVPATTVNKVCGSGLHSVTLAFRTIMAGEAECIVAGGTENMSQTPFLLPAMRWGARMGNATAVDSMINDGLWDIFNNYHMGITAENVAEKYGVTRQMQDEFAAASQQKASAAVENGVFDEEIVPVTIPQRKGDPIVFARDEYPRKGVTPESIGKLAPAFKRDGGTVTAGNASGINDGAAAIVVCSREFAEKHGLKPMLKIVATGSVGVDPSLMGIGPVPSVQKALEKAGLSAGDIDVFELNEAFAAQSCAVAQELKLPAEKININGGAIALGHPIGASGARILVTLAYQMKRQNAKYGVASLCIGGGMGEALVVESCK